jgi:hypothetical protein
LVPPPQAARSRAPATTRTPAPLLNRVVMAQTAMLVELNAMGVPPEVCAPGYMPST